MNEKRFGALVSAAVWLIVFLVVWLVERQPAWVSALVGVWWVLCLYMFWEGTIGRLRR
jgi:hypothetical protein